MLEQAMNASNADIVERIGAIAHHARGEQSLFGDRNVAGTGGNDQDGSLPPNRGVAFDGDGPGNGVKFGGAADTFDGGVDFLVGAGDQNVVMRVFVADHGADNFRHVVRRLSLAKNDFGIALAQSTVVVDFGDADIFEWQVLEALHPGFRGDDALAHSFQKLQNLFGVHCV